MSKLIRSIADRIPKTYSLILNAELYLYKFIKESETKHLRDKVKTLASSDTEVLSEIADEHVKVIRDWVTEKLRSYPWWSKGHFEVAECSLRLRDIGLSYSSIMACKMLGSENLQTERLLGKIYLSSGRYNEALSVLKKVLESSKKEKIENIILEDIAAALIPLNQFNEAKEFLERIPKEKRSISVNTYLDFLRKKVVDG